MTVALHKHTEERMVKRRKVLGILYRREGGGKKRGDSGWTWGGTVEIEINSRLGRLFELGPKCGRKKAYE
jgi:hypothetical protein